MSKKVIIPTCGESSRFGMYSMLTSKCLFKIKGEVLIDRLIKQVCNAGAEPVVIVGGSKSGLVRKRCVDLMQGSITIVQANDTKTAVETTVLGAEFVLSSGEKSAFMIPADTYFFDGELERIIEEDYQESWVGLNSKTKYVDWERVVVEDDGFCSYVKPEFSDFSPEGMSYVSDLKKYVKCATKSTSQAFDMSVTWFDVFRDFAESSFRHKSVDLTGKFESFNCAEDAVLFDSSFRSNNIPRFFKNAFGEGIAVSDCGRMKSAGNIVEHVKIDEDDYYVRVTKDMKPMKNKNEEDCMAAASSAGIFVPKVVYDDGVVFITEGIEGKQDVSVVELVKIATTLAECSKDYLELFDFKHEVQQYASYYVMPRKSKEKIDKLYRKTEDGNCMLHGDLHKGNAIRTKDGRIFLFDFEFCKRGNRHVDIATAIVSGCSGAEDMQLCIDEFELDKDKLKPYIALQSICFYLWYKDYGWDDEHDEMKYWKRVFENEGEIR